MKQEIIKHCSYIVRIVAIIIMSSATPLMAQTGIFDKCCTDVKACCKGKECDYSTPRCAMTMDLENDRRFGRQEGPFILLQCRKEKK